MVPGTITTNGIYAFYVSTNANTQLRREAIGLVILIVICFSVMWLVDIDLDCNFSEKAQSDGLLMLDNNKCPKILKVNFRPFWNF